MAKNTRLDQSIVNAQADILAAALKDGFMDIHGGTQPQGTRNAPGSAPSVSLKLGSPAFLPAEDGVIAANPIASGVADLDVEKATWARLYRADHKTPVMDVSVGTKDANVILPTTHIVRGVTVSCLSFTHSVPNSTPGV
jgi:hypothetical protein